MKVVLERKKGPLLPEFTVASSKHMIDKLGYNMMIKTWCFKAVGCFRFV